MKSGTRRWDSLIGGVVAVLLAVLSTADTGHPECLAPGLEVQGMSFLFSVPTLNDYLVHPEAVDGKILINPAGKKVRYSVSRGDTSWGEEFDYKLKLTDVADPEFFSEMELYYNGSVTLTIYVRAVDEEGRELSRSELTGRELFNLSMVFFSGKVQTVCGIWTTNQKDHRILRDNLNRVNELTGRGISLGTAVFGTFTGTVAAQQGYDVATVVYHDGEPGAYSMVLVHFFRSIDESI